MGEEKKTWKTSNNEYKDFPKIPFFQRIKWGKAETMRQKLTKGLTFEKQLRLEKTGRQVCGYLVVFFSVGEKMNYVHMGKV